MSYNQLNVILQNYRNELEDIFKRIHTLQTQYLLHSNEIYRCIILLNEHQIQMKQLEIYEEELKMYSRKDYNNNGLASIVISKQPFPLSIRQNKPLEEEVTVRLLTGSTYNAAPTGRIGVEIVTSNSSKSKKNPLTVKCDSKDMENGIAVYNNMIFPHGTRKKAIHLKFKLSVKVGNIESHLESILSKPFIVKTNENQWQEAEGILLKMEAFGEENEVTWFKFANVLQRRYLFATKQDQIQPHRLLTTEDFEYIYHTKFNANKIPDANTVINPKQFDEFWKWFGPNLYKIRYQRHMITLWTRGIICGFINRTEAAEILQKTPVGTFIIRFSERCAGFVITYTTVPDSPLSSVDKEIRHYLIQPDDVMGKKTLPDFLGRYKPFVNLVKVTADLERGRAYDVNDKSLILTEYYSKKSEDDKTEGYDSQLQ
jgi:hypothetical protein